MQTIESQKQCAICEGFFTGDEIDDKIKTGRWICVHCQIQAEKIIDGEISKILKVSEARNWFKEETGGVDYSDIPNYSHNQFDVLVRFMKNKGFSYNNWNNTFEG